MDVDDFFEIAEPVSRVVAAAVALLPEIGLRNSRNDSEEQKEQQRELERRLTRVESEKHLLRGQFKLKGKRKDMRVERDSLCKERARVAAELREMEERISAEESRLAKFSEVRHDPDCLRILLFGKTGHGKSSTANRLIGDRSKRMNKGVFKVSADTESVTQSIKGMVVDPKDPSVAHLNYNHKFMVIDIPGTGETRGAEVASQHANRMVEYLKGIEFIHMVGLVQNGSDCRFTDDTVSMLQSLVEAFGNGIWAHVVLIITHVVPDYAYDDEDSTDEDESPDKGSSEIDRWISRFRSDIRARFGLKRSKALLKAVKIDNKFKKDYSEKCSFLVNELAAKMTSFQCDTLRSPLDDWKKEVEEKQEEMDKLGRSMAKSRADLTALRKDLDIIKLKLGESAEDSDDDDYLMDLETQEFPPMGQRSAMTEGGDSEEKYEDNDENEYNSLLTALDSVPHGF